MVSEQSSRAMQRCTTKHSFPKLSVGSAKPHGFSSLRGGYNSHSVDIDETTRNNIVTALINTTSQKMAMPHAPHLTCRIQTDDAKRSRATLAGCHKRAAPECLPAPLRSGFDGYESDTADGYGSDTADGYESDTTYGYGPPTLLGSLLASRR